MNWEEGMLNALRPSSKICHPCADSYWQCFEGFVSGERCSPSWGAGISQAPL